MPVVGAHFYVGDGSAEQLKTIPSDWYYTRFDAVDILYVGPVVCRHTDHIFSLQYVNDKNETVDYSNRFEWVVKRARYENPQIKIIASQWWGSSNVLADLKSNPNETIISPETADRIEKYTDSVRDFLISWQRKTFSHGGTDISLRVDGYDIDYEVGNIVDIVTKVYEKIRGKVDQFTGDNHIPAYLLSLTPATSKYVKDIAPFVNYINMQNYDGGIGVSAEDYINTIKPSPPSKLIWGLEAEETFKSYPKVWNENTNTSRAKATDFYSIDEQLGEFSRLHLGGLFVWRLNSDNWVYENALQLYVYNKLHPEAPKVGPAGLDVNVPKGFERGGRDENGKPVTPFTPEEWKAAHQWLRLPPGV